MFGSGVAETNAPRNNRLWFYGVSPGGAEYGFGNAAGFAQRTSITTFFGSRKQVKSSQGGYHKIPAGGGGGGGWLPFLPGHFYLFHKGD